MAQPVLTDLDFGGVARVLALPDATLPQQPATFAQLNAAVEGLAWKDNVRVAAQVNVTVSGPGAAIDGVTLAANDRVLLRNQTTTTENGIYVWNGAAVPATRSLDMNASTEFNSAVVGVDGGTDAGAQFRQTAVSPTVGTTPILFVSFGTGSPAATTGTAGIAALATQGEVDAGAVTNKIVTPATLFAFASRVRKFAADVGDGTATQYTVTHNLNTRDAVVTVRRNSGAFDVVICDEEMTTLNTVTVRFAVAPAAAAFRCIVLG